MKVKVKKTAKALKGLVVKFEDKQTQSDWIGVCEDLGDGFLEIVKDGSAFIEGMELEMSKKAVELCGASQFNRYFEIVSGGPVNGDGNVDPIDEVIEAIMALDLDDSSHFSKTTGKPNCEALEALLDRKVSADERNKAWALVEEE